MNPIRSYLSLGVFCLAVVSGAQSSQKFVSITQQPPMKRLSATPTGRKLATDKLHLFIGLKPRDAAGMQAFADDVSNPQSPNYRHFATPEELGQRFGQTQPNIDRIVAFLKSQGMTIDRQGKTKTSLSVSATVGQAEAAFKTTIAIYTVKPDSKTDDGTRFSFTTPLQLPATIAPTVVNIFGLENFTRPKARYLTPQQLQAAYTVSNLSHSSNGKGRVIAISSFDGFRVAEEAQEVSAFNLPVPSGGVGTNITVEPVSGAIGSSDSQGGEGDLDIQAVIAMAPLCSLIVYDGDFGGGAGDPYDVWQNEIDDNTADVVTMSYGWPITGSDADFAHSQMVQMSGLGITNMVSSGDNGTSLGNGGRYPYPADDPEVLLVGGTSLAVNSNGTRSSEADWSNGYGAGGGGWQTLTDSFNTRPAYQSTTQFLAQSTVPSVSSVPFRLVPDVAYDADPETGIFVFISGTTGGQIGGTSLATPLFAGSLADAEEQLITDGFLPVDANGHHRFGRINDLLYSYNGDSSIFFDITTGASIGNLPNGTAATPKAGWDFASGWGPVIWTGFVKKIENAGTLSSTSLNPTTVIGGSSTAVTGTVTLAGPAGPVGVIVSLASSNTAAATVPATVTVAAGATTATFSITTLQVSTSTPVTITGSLNGGNKTASVTLTPFTVTNLTVNPTSVVGGISSTGTVTISATPSGTGVAVTLSSSVGDATVPPTVTVPTASTTANFTITTKPVAATETVTITAGIGTSQKTAGLTLTAPALASLGIAPSTLVGGNNSTGTVTLTSAAPSAGMAVNLSSGNTAAASVPASVTVAGGATSATFTITTHGVASVTTSLITATLATVSKSLTMTIQPAGLASVTVSPYQSVGGSTTPITGTVTLNGAAPSGGITVTLTSNNTSAATVPGTVTVAAGSTSATFTVTTLVVTAQQNVTVSASQNGHTQTNSFKVNQFLVSSVSLSPATLQGGGNSTGTVTLNATPASTSVTVTLSSNKTAALQVPGTASVPAGSPSATFTATTSPVAANTVATVSASLNGGTQTFNVTVLAPNLSSLSFSPVMLVSGASSTGTVSITGAAPTGGMPIHLSSNNAALTVPGSVTIPAGGTSTTFTATSSGVTSTISATVTASISGQTITKTATIGVQPAGLKTISVNIVQPIGGSNQTVTGTATLNGVAPTGGYTVTLTSTNTAAATVPASVAIPAGSSSASFQVTTLVVTSSQSTTIKGQLGTTVQTSSISVKPFALLSLGTNPSSVYGGSNSVGTVTLNAAPGSVSGALTVNLSSNSLLATVPGSVNVPIGSVTGSFTIGTSAVTVNSNATISAMFSGGTQTNTIKIMPAAFVSVSVSPATVQGGSSTTVTGTVTLAGTAPAGGIVVTLGSGNTAVATVPANVTILAGHSTATFTVTTFVVTAKTSVVISGTASGVTQTATLTVTP